MVIKIKRLLIQNFKLFENFSVEFNNSNLVVFDGPNGFGKTSFYDAIELFLTGRLRRYDDLASKAVDKRHSIKGSPFLNHRSNSGDLIVKGELEVNGNIVCLIRHGNRNDLMATSRMDRPVLVLHLLSHFESEELLPIENEEVYLTSLLGKDYIKNFEFLNYIEQEENTYLLKCKDKDRKDAIGHLFNTSDFELYISKLKDSAKSIGTLCGSSAKAELELLKQKLGIYKQNLANGHVSLPYLRLVTWKEVGWDSEELKFPDEQYVEWLGEDGELTRLETFIANIEEFKNYRVNIRLDQLVTNELLLSQLLLCWNFIDYVDDLSNKLSLIQSIENMLQSLELGLLPAIEQGKIFIIPQLQKLLKPVVDLQAYTDSITAIQTMQKNSDLLSQLLVGVIDSRKIFIEKFNKLENKAGQEKSCPLCGYTWQDAEELKTNFDSQKDQLDKLISVSGAELGLAIDNFTTKFISPIRLFLNEYIAGNAIDKLFVSNLKEAVTNKNKLSTLYNQFVLNDIDLSKYLNNEPSNNSIAKLAELRIIVNSKKHQVNLEKIRPFFPSLFLKIFDDSFDYAASVDKSVLIAKRKYIEWQYSVHQSTVANNLQKEFDKLAKQYLSATSLRKQIESLKQQYEISLKEYQQNIIKNIEILFHIYSGRISQDYQGGLGLFIAPDKDGIRFLEDPSKTHDAIFTMSSGQLAALVISFTLALNKRYSKNKLLFIDDPVQTLDEINVAGLIELLRNEFSDHQIFISTHEDMMSSYMRYKFQKFGLHAERLSFKERQLVN